jgi:hypothetical protein
MNTCTTCCVPRIIKLSSAIPKNGWRCRHRRWSLGFATTWRNKRSRHIARVSVHKLPSACCGPHCCHLSSHHIQTGQIIAGHVRFRTCAWDCKHACRLTNHSINAGHWPKTSTMGQGSGHTFCTKAASLAGRLRLIAGKCSMLRATSVSLSCFFRTFRKPSRFMSMKATSRCA